MFRLMILFVTLIVISEVTFAQRVEPFTINSGGGSTEAQNKISLTFAVGESVIGNFAGIIPAMFQTADNVTDITDPEKLKRYVIYPNPVQKDLSVDSEGEQVTLYVYSLQGVLHFTAQSNTVSLEHLRSAPYLVVLKNLRGKIVASEIILKL